MLVSNWLSALKQQTRFRGRDSKRARRRRRPGISLPGRIEQLEDRTLLSAV